MADAEPTPPPLRFALVGENPARPFGMDAARRARVLAGNAGLDPVDVTEAATGDALIADLDFAWDPAWLKEMAGRPDAVLVKDGRAVMGHVAGADREPLLAAMRGRTPYEGALERIDADVHEVSNKKLRKRERPFVLPLTDESCDTVERAAYDASYKGVTDALTLYLWRKPAFYLTRWAARWGLSPNHVTLVGALLCFMTAWLWWRGHYWPGMATGFGFMVLDTVDGKLARCTGQSSKWGNVFDHGIDLVHPPFWYWAWFHGLKTMDHGFDRLFVISMMTAIVGGYIAQRVIEGIFLARYKMDIHVWRKFDSNFRLVTARRNPNMIILLASLIAGYPWIGIQLVALWTIVSLIVHAVQLAQANDRARRGRPVVSWLEA